MQDDNIIELGPHGNMTAAEALELTLREEPEKVIILQVCGCGCGGICIKTSAMTVAQVNMILDQVKFSLMGLASLGCCGEPEDEPA